LINASNLRYYTPNSHDWITALINYCSWTFTVLLEPIDSIGSHSRPFSNWKDKDLSGYTLSLYLMTAVGLLQKFEGYFAAQKDPAMYNPRWPAVMLFLGGLILFLYLGRRLTARLQTKKPGFRSIKSLSLLIVGLAALYAAIFNPFSLLLAVPLLFWLLIGGRRGLGYALDIIFFILGFSLLLYLFYSFGFTVLRINWYVLWYVMMMMAVPMVGFFTMSVIVAIVGAGLSMVVHPPVLVTAVEPTVEAVATD